MQASVTRTRFAVPQAPSDFLVTNMRNDLNANNFYLPQSSITVSGTALTLTAEQLLTGFIIRDGYDPNVDYYYDQFDNATNIIKALRQSVVAQRGPVNDDSSIPNGTTFTCVIYYADLDHAISPSSPPYGSDRGLIFANAPGYLPAFSLCVGYFSFTVVGQVERGDPTDLVLVNFYI